MAKHQGKNEFVGEGANGGCFVDIQPGSRDGFAMLRVGWSCVIVHDAEVPVTWIAELIAIGTGHPEKLAGFLREHNYGGGYALACDPPESKA